MLDKMGSSPLTRGGPARQVRLSRRLRLIPAYAGRTLALPLTNFATAAHPRLRGADEIIDAVDPATKGSSPLTRGGRLLRRLQLGNRRLIPAYAGRTWR